MASFFSFFSLRARLAQLMARLRRRGSRATAGTVGLAGRAGSLPQATHRLPGPSQTQAAHSSSRGRNSSGGSRQPAPHAHLHSDSMRSGREWLLPVLESRPANTMGSMPPSSSGRATWGGGGRGEGEGGPRNEVPARIQQGASQASAAAPAAG